MAEPPRETAGVILARAVAPMFQPVVFFATVILLAVIALIVATVFGWDQGHILENLRDGQYARGLITYLFAVGTVGAVIVLILGSLMGSGGDAAGENFGRAKEIFSLLIGIFGTIIGFYFGSIKAETEAPSTAPRVVLASFPDTVAAGSLPVLGYISGGTAPYRYSLGFDGSDRSPERSSADGWIRDSIDTPPASTARLVTLEVTASDATNAVATGTAEVVLRPAPPAPAPPQR